MKIRKVKITVLVSCTLLLIIAGRAAASDWAIVESIIISPSNPTSDDVVQVTMFGTWGSSCIPNDSTLAVEGTDIYLAVYPNYPPDIACAMVLTSWEWTESLGHLSEGNYTLNVMVGREYSPEPVEFTVGIRTCTYHVDVGHGDDTNDGLSKQSAFATIQKGIDTAEDRDTVLVYPGIYTEALDFKGKGITVRSAEDAAILQAPGDYAVSFFTEEGPDSVLMNFVITNSYTGVFMAGTSPTLTNLTIVDNETFGVGAYGGSDPYIANSIFWSNGSADLFQCQAEYSLIEDTAGTTDGLFAYWPFDESEGTIAQDLAGSYNGTVHGAQWAEGQVGGCLQFDGENDYVELPDNEPVWLPTNDFTLALWIYSDKEIGECDGKLLDLNCGASDHPSRRLGYSLGREPDGKVRFYFITQTEAVNSLYSSPLSKGHWYHITAVRCADRQAIYINGQLDNSRTCSAEPVDFVGSYDDNKVSIARATTNVDSPRFFFKGRIDEVMIFNRGLTSEKIQDLYEYGIVTNPLFADPNGGDYHLRSERGRYWPEHDVWVIDDVTSPAIDAGDPRVPPENEPKPNGGRMNIGAYAWTAYASRSEWPLEHDTNEDGIVNILDFAAFAQDWLREVDQEPILITPE